MVGEPYLSSRPQSELARDHLRRGRAPGEDRPGAVLPERRRLSDADPQGPAAARLALFQSAAAAVSTGSEFVMAGLVPVIHVLLYRMKDVDARAGKFVQPAQAWLQARARRGEKRCNAL